MMTKATQKLPLHAIEELRDKAYAIVGEPDPATQSGDRAVGIIESRDGTAPDVVREIKDDEFQDLFYAKADDAGS